MTEEQKYRLDTIEKDLELLKVEVQEAYNVSEVDSPKAFKLSDELDLIVEALNVLGNIE